MVITTWSGNISRTVKVKLIRDTGTGVITEDARGVRYFSRYADVKQDNDLFSQLRGSK